MVHSTPATLGYGRKAACRTVERWEQTTKAQEPVKRQGGHARAHQRDGARSLNGGGDIVQSLDVFVFDENVRCVEYLRVCQKVKKNETGHSVG